LIALIELPPRKELQDPQQQLMSEFEHCVLRLIFCATDSQIARDAPLNCGAIIL
jgi:hypothetical protein